LRDDGSVPVPFGADQQWTNSSNSGIILAWAIEWLERTMKMGAQRPVTRLKPTGPLYGETIEEYTRRTGRTLDERGTS
ncbi:MAG: hypothetical protein WCI73_08060, partial [Phycisphaerae bacterium]